MPEKCPRCGSDVSASENFCRTCGAKLSIKQSPTESLSEVNAGTGVSGANTAYSGSAARERNAGALPGLFSTAAQTSAGEAAVGTMSVGIPVGTLGVFKTIGGGIKRFFSSIKSSFKDPKKLIPAIVLFVIWLALAIMQAAGFNPFPIKMTAFLTFAEAGMSGGFFGAIGGIIGRGIFAGALTSLIATIAGKNKGEKRSFGQKIKGAFGVSLETLFPWLFGIGSAILSLAVMSGGVIGRYSFMGGVAAAFLAGKAALNNGFLQKLTGAVSSKFKCGKTGSGSGFIRGLTTGFTVAAFLGLFNIDPVLVITGAILAIAGLVLTILQKTGVIKPGKEAAK
ncbi:MAG: zinc ribbon domain-containing protein [Clostridia bacterium]|nr:zinc ribbon domain-containing protein [Clostridia bacterium]